MCFDNGLRGITGVLGKFWFWFFYMILGFFVVIYVGILWFLIYRDLSKSITLGNGNILLLSIVGWFDWRILEG